MSEIEIVPPVDPFGKWLFQAVTGQSGPIKFGIPGTGVVMDAQERVAALFELHELLKEMNENMKNIDVGIRELNETIKALGLGGIEYGTEDKEHLGTDT